MNRRFLGLDKEIQFLEMSKNRRIEIENNSIRDNYLKKIFKRLIEPQEISILNETTSSYLDFEELPID